MTCAEVRELLPEIALGVLSGAERDEALRHVEGCDECRHELEAFARVGDDLLHAAPSLEPPSGFEDRVLARMTERVPRRRWFVFAAAAVVALVVGAGTMYGVGAHDRHLAREYNEVLGTLHGTSIRSAGLRDVRNRVVGEVVLYNGKPSWIFVAVERDAPNGEATIRLIGRTTREITGLHIAGGHGAVGHVVPGYIKDVRAVQVIDAGGRVLLRAPINAE